ncbi:RNA 2'-phosphotransferase [Paenibacillus sp. IB182496]|uniref:Probable RNA 2'-phosphotransferase n=2 Tax=Paenibacillus sabuli TaxID=2772509 RepID=A0A927BQZ3_9BACL|nr:RNA 2'-phosphotransferase [Paenibacillus sabuli]MBD2843934.1 RNA 2'-phosphotransferase [Paenibacillus sabuli]
MKDEQLSKELSYALRHAPWAYELELDAQGWADVGQLLAALNETPRDEPITRQRLLEVMARSDKQRLELAGERIRAIYGHSIPSRIEREQAEPPEVLYHGTARRFLSAIRAEGLKPRARQYVHLAMDADTALQVGRRRDDRPVLLQIAAQAAWRDGVPFYPGNARIWLADQVSPAYIDVAVTDGS